MAMGTREYYDSYWTSPEWASRGEPTPGVERLLRRASVGGRSCLDVGCGDGRVTGRWLAREAGSYVGVDVSATAVDAATGLGLDARLIEDAAALPFPDGSFDVAVCFEVLEHLFSPQEAVREIRRVLERDGLLVVSVPNAAYWQRRLELLGGVWNPYGDSLSVKEPWRDPHIRFFSAWALRRFLETEGFRVLNLGGHDGQVVSELPLLRRVDLRRFQPAYERAERRFPGLLSSRLNALAVPAP